MAIALVVPPTGPYLLVVRLGIATVVFGCLYGFVNSKWRNAISGDLYRLRGMKRTGAPASLRTHFISLLFWSYALFLSFQAAEWADSSFWRIAPFIGFVLAGMISSWMDVRRYRSSL